MASQNLRRRLLFVAICLWTALIGFSAFWNLRNSEQQIMNLAYTEARANLNKDLSFRRWATLHGGVYVPVTDTQQSVPWLSHVPGRDVQTTEGRQLTLLNPASVLRQIMDFYAADYGVRGRIIGQRQLNPGNAPDDWERQELEKFTRGEASEVWAINAVDGKPHLRYLRAMYMEPGCEKCHGMRLFDILHKLELEDPCFTVERHPTTHETVIRGLGEMHLRYKLEKMATQFKLELDTRSLLIPYRETVTAKAEGHCRHKKQSGGAGQFGEV